MCFRTALFFRNKKNHSWGFSSGQTCRSVVRRFFFLLWCLLKNRSVVLLVLLKPQKEAAANTRAVLQRTPERFFKAANTRAVLQSSEHQSGSSKQRTPERFFKAANTRAVLQPSKEVQFQEEPQKKNRSVVRLSRCVSEELQEPLLSPKPKMVSCDYFYCCSPETRKKKVSKKARALLFLSFLETTNNRAVLGILREANNRTKQQVCPLKKKNPKNGSSCSERRERFFSFLNTKEERQVWNSTRGSSKERFLGFFFFF